MVTMKDIAREAGVSFMTVSNVIHGNHKKVSEKTAQRVWEIIDKMGYVPNMGARALVSRTTHLIAFAYQAIRSVEARNTMEDPFVSELVGALETEFRAAGYDMILSIFGVSDDVLETAFRWNVDGLIVTGAKQSQCQKLLHGLNKPIAFIDSRLEGSEEKPYVNVTVDDRTSAREMVRYLIEQGHRNIAFCSGMGGYLGGPDTERRQGYLDAMQEAGIEVPEDWVIKVGVTDPELHVGFNELVKRLDDFTALFFTADRTAAYMINYLKDIGIDVPKQVSVTGFDDNFYSTLVRPQLTTIRQNNVQKAQIAAQRLLSLIRKEQITDKTIYLPTRLIVRESVSSIKS